VVGRLASRRQVATAIRAFCVSTTRGVATTTRSKRSRGRTSSRHSRRTILPFSTRRRRQTARRAASPSWSAVRNSHAFRESQGRNIPGYRLSRQIPGRAEIARRTETATSRSTTWPFPLDNGRRPPLGRKGRLAAGFDRAKEGHAHVEDIDALGSVNPPVVRAAPDLASATARAARLYRRDAICDDPSR
jgi:hypothetical protein